MVMKANETNLSALPGSIDCPVDLDSSKLSMYRSRSLANLLKMGHCAPTVMKTVLDSAGQEQEWLVKLTAGMPGGIGNTGHDGIELPVEVSS